MKRKPVTKVKWPKALRGVDQSPLESLLQPVTPESERAILFRPNPLLNGSVNPFQKGKKPSSFSSPNLLNPPTQVEGLEKPRNKRSGWTQKVLATVDNTAQLFDAALRPINASSMAITPNASSRSEETPLMKGKPLTPAKRPRFSSGVDQSFLERFFKTEAQEEEGAHGHSPNPPSDDNANPVLSAEPSSFTPPNPPTEVSGAKKPVKRGASRTKTAQKAEETQPLEADLRAPDASSPDISPMFQVEDSLPPVAPEEENALGLSSDLPSNDAVKPAQKRRQPSAKTTSNPPTKRGGTKKPGNEVSALQVEDPLPPVAPEEEDALGLSSDLPSNDAVKPAQKRRQPSAKTTPNPPTK
ncbi:MAG: hypothetical protein LBS60_11925, partial [Deltaproteobacteria bacterium]|nr:hypothetical protein [Deltaproteobacteria bacterium]